jgi:hypothetical protein
MCNVIRGGRMDTKTDAIKCVLNSASFYKQKYYFNEEFERLPEKIKNEMKVITVCLAQLTRGIIMTGFYRDNGDFYIEAMSEPDDMDYDEIGARLEVNKVERESRELFEQLTLWYKTFVIESEKMKKENK